MSQYTPNPQYLHKYVLYFFIFCGLISCHNKNKEKVENIIKEWIGKEITYPNSIFTIKGKDTVFVNPDKYTFKILCYVNKEGCTSCKLKLREWDKYIKDMKKEYHKNIGFFFYYSPNNTKEITYHLIKEDFNYPVCIDIKDSINIINKLPVNSQFQTFLLDKNNKIIAIGNPILSSKVQEMFSYILSNKINTINN